MGHLRSHITPIRWLALCTIVWLGCGSGASIDEGETGPDFAVQGEYRSASPAVGAQVIARGGGEFELSLLRGGLPGDGWDGSDRERYPGRWKGQVIPFDGIQLRIEGGTLRGSHPELGALALERVERSSPTLGASPPEGATVLFGGPEQNAFDGIIDERGFLASGATSRETFESFDLHLEFRTPFMPTSSGQSRGNSGVYLQERYEIQVLDSFGEDGADNECGGIYGFRAPLLNMALPPLVWQTYDVEFRAAQFDDEGNRASPARLTVRHNGVLIHEDVRLDGPTGLGDPEGPTPGALVLQDHWNPVFYRNIWVVPKQGPPVTSSGGPGSPPGSR